MKLTQLIALLSVVACCIAQATPFGQFDLSALPEKQATGRHARAIHVQDDAQRHLHFEYDVQHADGVVLLDHHEHLTQLTCLDNDVVALRFDAARAAPETEFVRGALLAGGRHWGCLRVAAMGGEAKASVLLRRVLGVKRVSDTELQVSTEEAEYHHFFKDGTVKFSTNMYPEDHFTFHHANDEDGHAVALYEVPDDALSGGLRKRSLRTWLRARWARVLSLGKKIWTNIKMIYTLGVTLFLSNTGYSHTWSQNVFGINFDASRGAAKAPISLASGNIVCTNCFASLDVALQFEMNITNAQLSHMLVRAIGSSRFNFEAQFNYNKQFAKDGSFIWAHLKSNPIYFSIAGIPFIMELEAPVEVGYSVDIRIASHLTAKAFATGEISYGMLYDGHSLKPVSSHSWESHGDLGRLAIKEDGDVEVYVMPQVVVLVDKIGGPNFSLHSGLTGSADASTSQCLGASGLEAHVNFDLEVGVGAIVDVKIGTHQLVKKQWGPNPVFSMTHPVISGCVAFTGSKFRLVPGSMIAGNTWSNQSPITCSDMRNASIALQLLEYDPTNPKAGGRATFGGVFNGHNTHGACTMQTTYTAIVAPAIGARQNVKLVAQHSAGVTFTQCADDSQGAAPPAYLYGYFTTNATNFVLTNLHGCPYQITLSQ